MTVLVAVLVFMANLALGAPLPLPDVIATTTLVEPELASLLPVLDFLSTFVFSNPTQSTPILSPVASSTSSAVAISQTTSQAVVSSSTSSSAVQQETESTGSTENTNQLVNNNNNVQTEVTHGPVTFGELTTPSEGGTFNKFVENADGTNSSITGKVATSTRSSHSVAHASTFAANTLTSYALFTQLTTVHLYPTSISTSKASSTHFAAPSPTSKASAVNYNRPLESHKLSLAKRLFPSLFKDNEGFDRFDVPGSSHGNKNNDNDNGQKTGQFLPPNVVPPGASLFGPPPPPPLPKGNGKGSHSENEGNNNANNGANNGPGNQDNGPGEGFNKAPAGPSPGLFLPPPPRGLPRKFPEPSPGSTFSSKFRREKRNLEQF